jgi:cation-transporting ATPase I
MNVPGVNGVRGLTGQAVQALRAGVQGAADAAGAVQTLSDPMVRSVGQATGRVLGRNTHDSARHALPPVRWQSGQRVHLDLDPLLPFPRWHQQAARLEEPVRQIAGVTSAHVEGALGRLVIQLADDVDGDRVLDKVRAAVASVADSVSPTGLESAPRTAPFADPGNPLALVVPLTAAAMDVVAVGAAITGLVGRLPAGPKAVRAASTLISNQPRLVSVLESRLGRVGTDLTLAATMAITSGLTQAIGTPLLDLAQRGLQISEASAHREVWRQRERQLANPKRPQAPVVPVISSARKPRLPARHRT